MNNITKILLAAIVVLLVLVAGYRLIQIYGSSKKLDLKQEILGTWTTSDGIQKLVIKKNSLIHTDESIGIKDTCTYIIEHVNLEYGEVYFKPTEDNERGILGSFEEIKYSSGSLFGSILIHDVGVHTTEFRKEW